MALEGIAYFVDEESDGNCFYIKYFGKEVSYLVVNHSENDFPYVLSMNTLENFRRKGFMESLLRYAKDYYSDIGKVLMSGKLNVLEIKKYYSSLEKKGLVRMGEDGRWEFI